jgi:uncharacterized protein YjbI with pentapeptide repeats
MSEPSASSEPIALTELPELRADCARCAGLCCVVPAFSRSADFAIDKPAGQPCRHLGPDYRCGIHADLRERGFRGCAVYDCLGAGQQVCQVTFGGQDWADPATAGQMHAVFPVMRQLHELLWHLAAALSLPEAGPVQAELRQARQEIGALTRLEATALLSLDLDRPWQQTSALLRRASELARAGVEGADHAGADLAGARLRDADLTGASLRGTVLIGADLHAARLRRADLTGADPRDADLGGADLAESLFVTGSARRGPWRRRHPAAAVAAAPGPLAAMTAREPDRRT